VKRNHTSKIVAVAVAAVVLATATAAHAAEPTRRLYPEGGNGGGNELLINQLSSLLLVLPGIPLLAIAAESGLGDSRQRMTRNWTLASYIISSIGIASGGALIVADSGNAKSLIAGGILVGLGALDLGLTFYRNRAANKPSGEVSLKPIGGVDSRGGAFAGVGLTITGF